MKRPKIVLSATTPAQRAAIRWQVRTGRYVVNPAKVSAAMMADFTGRA